MSDEQPLPVPSPTGHVPPALHCVATVRRGVEELRIGLLVHDTGVMGILLRVWRPGALGHLVEDLTRRLSLRMDEVPAVVEALLAATGLAATVEPPASAPRDEQPDGRHGSALDYGAAKKRKRKAATPTGEAPTR